jgi:hypothetical protein
MRRWTRVDGLAAVDMRGMYLLLPPIACECSGREEVKKMVR